MLNRNEDSGLHQAVIEYIEDIHQVIEVIEFDEDADTINEFDNLPTNKKQPAVFSNVTQTIPESLLDELRSQTMSI